MFSEAFLFGWLSSVLFEFISSFDSTFDCPVMSQHYISVFGVFLDAAADIAHGVLFKAVTTRRL